MRHELTPWFKPNEKPKRKGVYQREHISGHRNRNNNGVYAYWDGEHWYQYGFTPDQALVIFLEKRVSANKLFWRGLKMKYKILKEDLL